MRSMVTVLLAGSLVGTAVAQEIVEPRSGVKFAPKMGPTSLLGTGVRTKMMGKVKVYAAGLYVADSALAGPLAPHKGQTSTPAFYQALVSGDFEKAMVLKFVRDVSTDQVRDAFRDSLKGANAAKVDLLLGYFGETKNGQECWRSRWRASTRFPSRTRPSRPRCSAFGWARSPSRRS
jgi:hypothetical protein